MAGRFKLYQSKVAGLMAEYLGNRAVLVVDPSANYRASIRQFLHNIGVKNSVAVATVAEARRKMAAMKVGFLIVEWMADAENGLQFCRQLQKNGATDLPFLLTTGENHRTDVVLASEVGIDGYLLKPFSYENFVHKVAEIIAEAHHPDPLRLLLEQGDRLLRAGDDRGASEIYGQLLQLNPRSARALRGLAEVARAQQNNRIAEQFAQEAVLINPQYLAAYRTLLELYQSEGDVERTFAQAQLLHEYSPDNPRYTLILASSYLSRGMLTESQKYFLRTIRLAPSLAEGYRGIGTIALERKNPQKAARYLKKALDLDQDDASALNSLGMAMVSLGRVEEGIHHYRMALAITGADYRVYFNIAQAFEKLGEIEKAHEYFELSVRSEPNFEKARRGLNRLQQRLDREKHDLNQLKSRS